MQFAQAHSEVFSRASPTNAQAHSASGGHDTDTVLGVVPSMHLESAALHQIQLSRMPGALPFEQSRNLFNMFLKEQ